MRDKTAVPILSVVGWSGTGKTTFLEKLVTRLKDRGYRVGFIKHHRGPFDIDRPGKDTWRLAGAGAACTAIAGPGKVGLVLQVEGEMSPVDIAALMPGMDLIITEGYKQEGFPQIEVRRAGCGAGPSAARDGQLVAVVGDNRALAGSVPCYDIDDAAGVADFIVNNFLD